MKDFAREFEDMILMNGGVTKDAPEHPLVQRLKDYYLGLDKNELLCTEQKSVYSLSRPGQIIDVDNIDLATFWHPDVKFVHYKNEEWGHEWSNLSCRYNGPYISELPYQSMDGCYGFLNQWHTTDDHKTEQLLDRYIQQGYGMKGKQMVIFMQNEDQHTFTLLGLCTLNEQESQQTGVINWLFPPFLAARRFD